MKNKKNGSFEHAIDCFEKQYQEKGLAAQRKYPNEGLVQFLASAYFSIPHEARNKIKVLEVGCGTGANLWMMAKEGFSTFGVDSSSTAIDLATAHLREKWGLAASLKVGDFHSLPYDADFFDAVVDVVSLQHLSIKDSGPALVEISKVLKKGSGRFFSYRLSDHSVMYERGKNNLLDIATLENITDDSLPLANNGPISFWSPTLVRQMYGEAGLCVESIERVGRTYDNGMFVEYLSISGRSA